MDYIEITDDEPMVEVTMQVTLPNGQLTKVTRLYTHQNWSNMSRYEISSAIEGAAESLSDRITDGMY